MNYIKVILGKSGNNKIFLEDRITPHSRPLDVLVTAIHECHLRNYFSWQTQVFNQVQCFQSCINYLKPIQVEPQYMTRKCPTIRRLDRSRQ